MIENKKEVIIREIKCNSEEYRNELKLRDEVLRKPLGMCLYDENMEAEKNDIHIGAYLNNSLVGVLILTKLNSNDLKMRQVAVKGTMQSKKIGSKMVCYAEDFAKNSGYKNMMLNARKTAVAFYEKQGYKRISDEFLEINLPHYKMSKCIG
ncbi:MAG: GNAT family N-acetyltransferase [Paludibacter sp.]|nr:GNAT family N-acetyltransferase [Paludibacter sp.]